MSSFAEREAAIAARKQLLVDLIGALPDPVLVVDAATRIVAANDAAHEVFMAVREGDALAFALRAPDVLGAVARVIAGEDRQTTEWRERSPVERFYNVHVAPIAIDGGRMAVVELRDMTEARRVERMRVNFIANVSHELRTPLTSLLGFIETLQGTAREDAVARERFLAIMADQGRRMARLVDDLLSLSRIELNEHVRPQASVDLVSTARRIVDALEPLAREAGVTVRLDAPARAIVRGDADELSRLTENLVENAIKYGASGQPDPRVDISITVTEAGAEFAVKDNGYGIAAEHVPRLTERFYRVDAPASRAKGGTGLGLAIVKHITLRHRARLVVDSQPGAGARFAVIFPADIIPK